MIGGGAAGIAVAREFVDTPLRVLLLESGGLRAEQGGRRIYRVLGGRSPTLSVDPSRPWYFGGNTNYWAGNCRPLDDADFEPRDWIPHSGWPFRRQELLPYYQRAQSFSGLADLHWYEFDACRPQLEHPPLSVDAALLTHRIVHECPVLSFVELHRRPLEASRNVQISPHTRALRLETDPGGKHVSAVEVVLHDGTRSRVEAGVFILAAGGVENARLLLCSNGSSPSGLGNDHDLVGRFFMEHWHVDIGLGGWGDGIDLGLYGERQRVGSALVWAQLALSEDLMREDGVPGQCLWFLRRPRSTPSVDSLRRIRVALHGRGRVRPLTDAQLLLSDPAEAAGLVLRRVRSGSPEPSEGFMLRVQIEQTPDPENRIRLSSRRDDLGQPHAELVLRLGDDERRAQVRSLQRAADALGLKGARIAKQGRLLLDAGRVGSFWHHMGTTRMSEDPGQGVVDRNGRVHGTSNLFVAGSSVFPTGGTAAPTLTIVALALRLADHIREGLPRRS